MSDKKNKLISPRVLKGFRDSFPEQEIEKKRLISIIEKSFESFGFAPIDTPVLEYTEILLGKGSGETDKQLFRFNQGKRDVAMRFDLTIPFARFMAQNYDKLPIPFKRYHIAKVWRGENPQRGRFREFFQCDFDMVGVDTTSSDLEIMLLMSTTLKAIGVDNFQIEFSHRGLFNKFLEHLDISDKLVEILRTVDKLAKIGKEEVIKLLNELTTSENSTKIVDFIQAEDDFETTLAKMVKLSGGDCDEAQRLREIWTSLEYQGLTKNYKLNPSITRGLDYYTGLVFETFLTDLPGFGAVFSGGRYNNLASLYTKQELPGIGASLGLDRLLAGLEELGRAGEKKSTTDLLIFMMDENLLPYYHKIAADIRAAGISCEVYPKKKKLQAQFKFAEQKNVPYGLICGDQERKADKVNLKNLIERENTEGITVEELIKKIKES